MLFCNGHGFCPSCGAERYLVYDNATTTRICLYGNPSWRWEAKEFLSCRESQTKAAKWRVHDRSIALLSFRHGRPTAFSSLSFPPRVSYGGGERWVVDGHGAAAAPFCFRAAREYGKKWGWGERRAAAAHCPPPSPFSPHFRRLLRLPIGPQCLCGGRARRGITPLPRRESALPDRPETQSSPWYSHQCGEWGWVHHRTPLPSWNALVVPTRTTFSCVRFFFFFFASASSFRRGGAHHHHGDRPPFPFRSAECPCRGQATAASRFDASWAPSGLSAGQSHGKSCGCVLLLLLLVLRVPSVVFIPSAMYGHSGVDGDCVGVSRARAEKPYRGASGASEGRRRSGSRRGGTTQKGSGGRKHF